MPYIEASSLADIPKKDRSRFQKLLYNKAVLGYAFSYDRLHKLISQLAEDEEDINEMIDSCVVAHNKAEMEEAKKEINEVISSVMAANGITSLDAVDPFGREKAYLYMESHNSTFKKDKAIQIAASKYKIPPETMAKIIEEATVKTPFVTVQCRDKKSNGKDEEE